MGRPEGPMSNGRRLLADPRARVGRRPLALAVLAALFAPHPGGRPVLAARHRRHPVPLSAHYGSSTAPFTCSAPTGSAATSGRGSLWGTRFARRRPSGDPPLHRPRRCRRRVAGFWRGWIGATLLGFTDFALALPRVVLLLLLASLWQPSATLVSLVLGFTGWMPIARLVYGEVRALAVRPFVEGAVGSACRDGGS